MLYHKFWRRFISTIFPLAFLTNSLNRRWVGKTYDNTTVEGHALYCGNTQFDRRVTILGSASRDPTRRARPISTASQSQSRADVAVAAPTVSYERSTLNLIHFNLTKVPADSAEEGLISVGHWFTADSRVSKISCNSPLSIAAIVSGLQSGLWRETDWGTLMDFNTCYKFNCLNMIYLF